LQKRRTMCDGSKNFLVDAADDGRLAPPSIRDGDQDGERTVVIVDARWRDVESAQRREEGSDQLAARRSKRIRTREMAPVDSILAEVASSCCPPIDVAERSYVGAILRAIHHAPFDPRLSAAKLKASCGTRDNNVASEFKLATGCSIMRYVACLRLTAAAVCLQRTDFPVATVARHVGFSSLQRFYAAFVRHYGDTPAHYARRVRVTGAPSARPETTDEHVDIPGAHAPTDVDDGRQARFDPSNIAAFSPHLTKQCPRR